MRAGHPPFVSLVPILVIVACSTPVASERVALAPVPTASAEELAALREIVREARVARRRACRARPRRVACEREHAALAAEIAALAAVLGCPIAPRRHDAIESLESLVEALEDAEAAIDPSLLRDCLREGGDEADCELLEGQQHEAVAAAQAALDEAYEIASVQTLATECAPGDADLVFDTE